MTPPSSPGLSRGRAWLLAGVLAGLTALAYFPSLRAGFIWDDDAFLTQNRLIKASDGLVRFWFTTQPADYWPVTSTALWLEWRLWGLHAAGYHAVNLALHIAEALLLWAALRRLRVPGAYLAALLFALHPVNVESVAWITQRKNLMAMLFFLLGILAFLRSEDAPPERARFDRWLWLSWLAFVLAMLSKGSVAVLPVVLLGIVLWRRAPQIRDLVRLAPFFAATGALTWVNLWFQRHHATDYIRPLGGLDRLLGAGGVVWFYLSKAVLPIRLMFVYPQWRVRAADPIWWLPLFAALALTAALWRWRNRGARAALFAWLYFGLALVPVMGLADVHFMRYSLVADHYQHLALIGVAALAGAGWAWGRARCAKAADLAALAVVGVFALLTWRQCRLYRDDETLYRATLRLNPGCWMAHNNLGLVLAASGRADEAIEHYAEAIRLNPEFVNARVDWGLALAGEGRLDQAAGQYREALRIDPASPQAHTDLGNALALGGRPDEAIAQYREALRSRSDFLPALVDLGAVLAAEGRSGEAAAEYEAALRLEPEDASLRRRLEAVRPAPR